MNTIADRLEQCRRYGRQANNFRLLDQIKHRAEENRSRSRNTGMRAKPGLASGRSETMIRLFRFEPGGNKAGRASAVVLP